MILSLFVVLVDHRGLGRILKGSGDAGVRYGVLASDGHPILEPSGYMVSKVRVDGGEYEGMARDGTYRGEQIDC